MAVLLWVNKALNGILGSAAEGLTTQTMMQGRISLVMTVLIVTVPPMAAAYFQGTLGNFMSYSAFGSKDGKDKNPETAAPPVSKNLETKDSGSVNPGSTYQPGNKAYGTSSDSNPNIIKNSTNKPSGDGT